MSLVLSYHELQPTNHPCYFPHRLGQSVERAHSEQAVTDTDTGLRRFLFPGQEKKRKKKGGGGGGGISGTAYTGGHKGLQAVRLESVAGGGTN